jgi:hypothetical protein
MPHILHFAATRNIRHDSIKGYMQVFASFNNRASRSATVLVSFSCPLQLLNTMKTKLTVLIGRTVRCGRRAEA